MFDEIEVNTANMRTGSKAGQCCFPEPSGSGFGLFVLRRNPLIPPHAQSIRHI